MSKTVTRQVSEVTRQEKLVLDATGSGCDAALKCLGPIKGTTIERAQTGFESRCEALKRLRSENSRVDLEPTPDHLDCRGLSRFLSARRERRRKGPRVDPSEDLRTV